MSYASNDFAEVLTNQWYKVAAPKTLGTLEKTLKRHLVPMSPAAKALLENLALAPANFQALSDLGAFEMLSYLPTGKYALRIEPVSEDRMLALLSRLEKALTER